MLIEMEGLPDSIDNLIHSTYRAPNSKVEKMEYEFFRVSGRQGYIKIEFEDVVYIKTDENDSRNKALIMRGHKSFILMNYKFIHLIGLTPLFIQANKFEVVNIDFVDEIRTDSIILKEILEKGKPKQIKLGRPFRKFFLPLAR